MQLEKDVIMNTFKALRVEEHDGTFTRQVKDIPLDTLPDNDVTIRVAYSAINYKDALSATGNRGVTKTLCAPFCNASVAGQASRTWMWMRFCAISETFSARAEEGRDRDRIQVGANDV